MKTITWHKVLRATKQMLAIAAVLAAIPQTVVASDPIGVYAIVDKVVFEPSEKSPERIRIWGVFSFAEGGGINYTAPKQGYLYYRLPQEKRELARREWKDIKSLAGKRVAVGFGARRKENGTVRLATKEPGNPHSYPLGFGLVRVETPPENYAALTRLFEAAEKMRSLLESGPH